VYGQGHEESSVSNRPTAGHVPHGHATGQNLGQVILTSITYSAGTATPTNFENRKIKGHTVTFSDQSVAATVNGQPETQTRASGAVVVGRHALNFSVDDPDAAAARVNVERWISRYLR
jgi:hypothetical protein